MFLEYINDMPEKTTSSDIKLFADGNLLYRTINNQTDIDLLQKDLVILEDWENKWQMNFNAQKCIVIWLAPKNKQVGQTSYKLHGHTLDDVGASKYEGVTINMNLSWDRHINNPVGKGNKTLGFIRWNLKKLQKTCQGSSIYSNSKTCSGMC